MWKITCFSPVIDDKYSNLYLVYKIIMPLKNVRVYTTLLRADYLLKKVADDSRKLYVVIQGRTIRIIH